MFFNSLNDILLSLSNVLPITEKETLREGQTGERTSNCKRPICWESGDSRGHHCANMGRGTHRHLFFSHPLYSANLHIPPRHPLHPAPTHILYFTGTSEVKELELLAQILQLASKGPLKRVPHKYSVLTLIPPPNYFHSSAQ